eukprot:Em0018g721a
MAAKSKGQKDQLKKRFGVSDAENPILDICVDANQFDAELVKLCKSDVSEFLGKHVESEKCIYQQGTLRKLSTAALELGAIKMTIPEHDTILLSQAIASCTLLIPPSLKSSTRVTISAAIYGSAVSVVHKCTTTCSFVEKTASVVVEGCDTSINRLVFVHIGLMLCTVTTSIA